MDLKERALKAHEQWGGKIEVVARCEVNSKEDLSVAYTPGVAEPCLKIKDDPSLSYTYTRRHNLVAVITDGTAVLGLGDIGPVAGMPVMEGKCALFKAFADVDAFPLCVASKDCLLYTSCELEKVVKLWVKNYFLMHRMWFCVCCIVRKYALT